MNNVDIYLKQLDALQLEMDLIKTKIEDIKSKLCDEMIANGVSRCDTDSIRVSVVNGYKFSIPRDESIKVYEALEAHGYDCKKYDSTTRSKVLSNFLTENDELPDWLLGKVTTTESHSLKIDKR